MDTKEIVNEIKRLREKTGGNISTCIKVVKEMPNNSEEEKIFYIGYYSWLSTFLDGDRSIERYKKIRGV